MPIDVQIAQNLTATMVEAIFSAMPDPKRAIAPKVLSGWPMAAKTTNMKMEMPVYELDDSSGRAMAGTIHKSPIFADLTITANIAKTGLVLNESDFESYEIEKHIHQFQDQAASLPSAYDEKNVSRLLARGLVDKCTFDGKTFFAADHRVIPGKSKTFSNSIDCGLSGVVNDDLTVELIRKAIRKGINALNSIGFGDGYILNVFEPSFLAGSSISEQIISDSVDAKFISVNGGSQDITGWSTKYKLETLCTSTLDAQYAANAAAGGNLLGLGANPENVLYLFAKPKGDAAALATGCWKPFAIRSDLPALTSGAMVEAFSTQLSGFVGYSYGLPHFCIRLY